jgi:lipoate-protein ligase A
MQEKRDMISPTGFIKAFFENLKKFETSAQAYEHTEQEYMDTHNTTSRKYASYQSFMKIKNRLMTSHQI